MAKEFNENEIIKNNNGTWSHYKDQKTEWKCFDACKTDLSFCIQWEGR
jgi:hypothetical protein